MSKAERVRLGKGQTFFTYSDWRVAGRSRAGTKETKTAVPESNEEFAKTLKWYPTDPVSHKLPRRFKPTPAKLRSSITPGTVLIVLSGRFRGKRVVFLKQLPSGLLLVTGPYKVNGVPLRRLDQSYVIATSTKIDVSGVSIPESVNDDFFKSSKADRRSDKEKFFNKPKKVDMPAERTEAQKKVDNAILSSLSKDKLLKAYLNARFSLTNGTYAHELKF